MHELGHALGAGHVMRRGRRRPSVLRQVIDNAVVRLTVDAPMMQDDSDRIAAGAPLVEIG